jgi:hypothetical protein
MGLGCVGVPFSKRVQSSRQTMEGELCINRSTIPGKDRFRDGGQFACSKMGIRFEIHDAEGEQKFEILDMRATGTPEGRNHQKGIIEVERVVKS